MPLVAPVSRAYRALVRNCSRVQRFVPDEKRISRIRLELRGVQVEIFGQAHTLCGAIPTIFGSLLILIMSIR